MAGPQRLVFLGGVSGVGKTHALSELSARDESFEPVGAGRLIAEERSRGELPRDGGYVRPRVADTAEADANQELLLRALERRRAAATKPMILDGHFVIPTESGARPVAIEVFDRMKPDALVLLHVDANVVAVRLRDRPEVPRWWDGKEASLQRLLEAEAAHAHSIAKRLGRPLLCATISTIRDLLRGALRRD